ncbi:MAG: P-II family nitrogen regulator [Sulfuricaulis sp.]
MKNLTLIVHADVEQALADVLRGLKSVQGFTFTRVEGHGAQDDRDPSLSARDRVVGYTPHVRVDILLDDTDVAGVLTALRKSSGGIGRGVYWVTEVVQQGQL